MTPEEKVALLKKAGVWDVIGYPTCIDKLFDLVAAHEHEKQAEQEPVAYVYEKDVAGIGMRKDVAFTKHVEVGTDLYAAPVRTKDLTDDEIRFWIGRFPFLLNEESEKWVIGFARAVIAADREKNRG